MIKIIASDMDGTLLNEKHIISKENIKAINKAEQAGIIFTISTGREYDSVKPLLEESKIRCQCILMNGAEYRDEDGNILECINIDKNKAIKIIEILKNINISFRIMTNKGVYTTDTREKALEEIAYRIQSFEPGTSFEEALKLAEINPFFLELKYISNIEEFFNNDIEFRKFVAFNSDLSVLKEARERLESIHGLAISSSFEDNIEITDEKAQKGIMLAKVVDNMGINRDEVLVLGDSFNDYSMFTEFTESVAMGNAIPEVKEIAKYITDTNINDGVAKAIYKIL
ncbi:Cof-type HAD-IIB family hydrolase [Clostridium sp. CTA-5]